jgi:hypothetical protein
MMDDMIELPSGAILKITVAPFADAHGLLKAILKAVKGMQISGDALDTDMSLDGLRKSPAVLSQLIDKVLSIATSEEVEMMLWKCFERTTYQGVKLVRTLLDDPNLSSGIREDYYTICMKVIEANCKPFFKQTFSGLLASAQTPAANQK